jgi:hypothetical protein
MSTLADLAAAHEKEGNAAITKLHPSDFLCVAMSGLEGSDLGEEPLWPA